MLMVHHTVRKQMHCIACYADAPGVRDRSVRGCNETRSGATPRALWDSGLLGRQIQILFLGRG